MLFQQVDVGHGHASVNRLAHVVNRQQGHLHRSERFHFYAGGAYGFGGDGATIKSTKLVCLAQFLWVSGTDLGQAFACPV